MSYRFLRFVALPLLIFGQVAPQGAERSQTLQTCTLIGCFSSAAISIQLSNGGVPKFDLTIDVDGELATCTLPAQSGIMPFGVGSPCGRAATINVREVSPRKVEALVVIRGTPKRIAVSLFTSGHAVAQQTFLPDYVENSPNGPNCEPHCWVWRSAWLV